MDFLKKNIVSLLVGGVIVLAVTYMLGGFSGCVNVSEELSSSTPAVSEGVITPTSTTLPAAGSHAVITPAESTSTIGADESVKSASTLLSDGVNTLPTVEKAEVENAVDSVKVPAGNSGVVIPETTSTETSKTR